MTTIAEGTRADDRLSWNFLREDMGGQRKKRREGGDLGFPSEARHIGSKLFPFTTTSGQEILGSCSKITPISRIMEIDALLCLRASTHYPLYRMEGSRIAERWGLEEILGFSQQSSGLVGTMTTAATEYAKSHRLYGALVLAKKTAHELIPAMRALNVDLKEDPDEGGYPTICFTITIKESVDHVLELDDALQDALYERIPAELLPYFSFAYQFE